MLERLASIGDRFLVSMRDRRRWGLLMIAVAVTGSAWIAWSAVPPSAVTGGRIPSPRAGFLSPDFTVELADGSRQTLSGLRGHPVVLNLWASWCPPCRAEMPALERVHRDFSDRGLRVLALNVTRQDSEAAARAFAEVHAPSLPIGFDRQGEVEALYQVRALPTTFFIDADGVIRRVMVGGPVRESVLRAEAEALFAESAE
jgi:cytochrome c biogenesis protein CcmG/thiol:disulfide interchange protein DsbE